MVDWDMMEENIAMKAIRIGATGGPEALELVEAPRPAPGPGQVLVRIEATGVNFIEVYQRTGLYPVALPATPGSEAAGTVAAVGEGVSGFGPGDRVASTDVLGAYAEYGVVAADRLVRIPAEVTTRQAAAVLLQGMTAHYLTASTFPLKPADTCLVHAAAGGTGLLICQMARMRGARVMATVSTEAKAALARAAGASEVILYSSEDFVARTKALTGGVGVQVVYDSVGSTTFLAGFDALARRGMMVLFGQSSGPVAPIDPRLLVQKGSLFLTRPALGAYIATPAELQVRAAEVLDWVGSGALTVRIGAEFPLADAAQAHRELEGRRTTGKVLLVP
jgi:NADPH2:quinone reductase